MADYLINKIDSQDETELFFNDDILADLSILPPAKSEKEAFEI